MIDAPAPQTIVAVNLPPVTTDCKYFLLVRYGTSPATWSAYGWGHDTPEQAQLQLQSMMPGSSLTAWRIIRVDGLPVHVPHPDKAN